MGGAFVAPLTRSRSGASPDCSALAVILIIETLLHQVWCARACAKCSPTLWLS